MTKTPLACIILAAGQSTRMKSALPKALHELAGRPMIGWLLETVSKLSPEKIIVVIGPGMDDLASCVAPHPAVIQHDRRGTGDAVKTALPALKNFTGDVLLLNGDGPLIGEDDLRGLIAARHKGAGLSVLGMDLDDPAAFGRLVLRADKTLERIVEAKDCTPGQRDITLCNAGAYCADGAKLADWINRIGNDNAQKEYYLTDIVEFAAGKTAVHVTADPESVRGINSRSELAVMEKTLQQKLRNAAMANGATLLDPDTVYFSWDTELGRDVVIEPSVFFGPGVKIADNVHIKAFTHIEDAVIGAGASVGPHARLRPGAVIGENSRIGNFVEIKNATLGAGVKAGHLAYIGDADIGDNVNFSCGAITVNYDGTHKHKTIVGANAMIGSNVNLVAPLTIGEGAYVAAGSTITKDVPADALAVAREKPSLVEGWAARRRAKKSQKSG